MAHHWLETLGYLIAAGVVLLIPGASLLAWLHGSEPGETDPLASLADAAALSIAIMALLALWLFLGGITASDSGLRIFNAAGLLFLGGGIAHKWILARSPSRVVQAFWRWLLVFAFLAGLAAWRFFQARDLVLPAWVDSVHHTLVVRKIFETGGLPPDLNPYFPATFFYHYGFHLATALFVFWSHQSPASAVLWFGNVVNALVTLSVYKAAFTFLAVRAKKRGGVDGLEVEAWYKKPAVPALAAALLTNFVLQMPAYYVTWGRYTLLTGLILLGPALAAAWELWQRPGKRSIGAGIRLAILVGGLGTTHYFAMLLLGLFLLILGLVGLVQSLRSAERRAALFALVAWTGLGLFVASPWVWRVGIYSLDSIQVQVVSPIGQNESGLAGSFNYLKYLIYLVGPLRNHILFGLAGVGLLGAFFRPRMRIFAAWTLLLVLLSLPWGPRLGPFRPDHFAIILFFPAAVLLGILCVHAINWLSRIVQPGTLERAWFRPVLLGILLALFLVWGMRDTQRVLNSTTILVDRSDLEALDWIQVNVADTARFYINSVRWQGIAYRGVDGGYWLMPYTGRSSLLPPVLYFNAPRDYIDQVTQWVERAGRIKGCSQDFWDLVQDAQLTHVYLYRGKGNLQPGALLNCPGVNLIYQNDAVFLYTVENGYK